VCVGSFSDHPLTLRNSGGCPLTVTDISSSSPEFIPPGVDAYRLPSPPAAPSTRKSASSPRASDRSPRRSPSRATIRAGRERSRCPATRRAASLPSPARATSAASISAGGPSGRCRSATSAAATSTSRGSRSSQTHGSPGATTAIGPHAHAETSTNTSTRKSATNAARPSRSLPTRSRRPSSRTRRKRRRARDRLPYRSRVRPGAALRGGLLFVVRNGRHRALRRDARLRRGLTISWSRGRPSAPFVCQGALLRSHGCPHVAEISVWGAAGSVRGSIRRPSTGSWSAPGRRTAG
jgi:hypothetical protein